MKVYRSVKYNNAWTLKEAKENKNISLKLFILKLMKIEFALFLVEGDSDLGVW